MDEQQEMELLRLMEQLRPFLEWVVEQPVEAVLQVVEQVETVCAVFDHRAIVRGPFLLCPDWWVLEAASLWLANYARMEFPTAATFFEQATTDARRFQQQIGTQYTSDCQHLLIEFL